MSLRPDSFPSDDTLDTAQRDAAQKLVTSLAAPVRSAEEYAALLRHDGDYNPETRDKIYAHNVRLFQQALEAPKATPDAVECAREILGFCDGKYTDEADEKRAATLITAHTASAVAEAREKALEEAAEAIRAKLGITSRALPIVTALKGRTGGV